MFQPSTPLTAICHDAGDGSGDLIVPIPPEVIEAMGLRIGDKLELEVTGEAIVLTPIQRSVDF